MSDGYETNGWTVVGRFLVGMPLFLAAVLSKIYVFKLLWDWFAVPLGAPTMMYWQTYGVLLLIGFNKGLIKSHRDDPDKAHLKHTMIHTSATSVVLIWLAYGVSWLVKTYGPTIGY